MNAGVYATGLKRWIFAIIKANAIAPRPPGIFRLWSSEWG